MDAREKTQAKEYAAQLKEMICLDLRLKGMSYSEMVAAGCGYKSRSGARDAVYRALKKNYKEPTEQVRFMEVARIEAMIMSNWDSVINGPGIKIKIEAGRFVLDLIARKCRILGIDAPAKVDIVGMLAPLVGAAGVDMADTLNEIENLLHQHQQAGRA